MNEQEKAVWPDARAVRETFENMAAAARRDGFVVTITQVPCEPLAMGNHRDVVTVRRVRDGGPQ